MAEVSLKGVIKEYDGGVRAVNRLSLDIADREFMVLVGPSGCGKSTLLRMIAGLEEITAGELRIGGRLCNDVAPKDRDIAMVFQNYALYPHLSVEENLAFGLKLKKLPKEEIKKRVESAAEMLGLAPYLARKPKALSGGQRQRVALGRAIVRKPKVFLFDEPLSNLDAKMRVQMRVEISRLAAELQTTMIYVTHDQTEAMTMGHRICCMKDGVIQQLGKPMELYLKPQNRFVAGFMGMPPMNFFAASHEGKQVKIPGLKTEQSDSWSGDASWVPALKEQNSTIQSIGIRPEDLRIIDTNMNSDLDNGRKVDKSDDASQSPIIVAEIELMEPLGSETLVHCRSGKHALVAKTTQYGEFTRGQSIRLQMISDKIHAFGDA